VHLARQYPAGRPVNKNPASALERGFWHTVCKAQPAGNKAGLLTSLFMFLLLAACLGQSFLASPAPALRPPARVAILAQTAATAPAQAAPRKHPSAKLAKAVPAIKLTPCDKEGDYDIPAQRFDETMQQIAHATGCGINAVGASRSPAQSARLSAMRVGAVHGHLTVRQACLMAIKGSAFAYAGEKDNVLYVRLRK